MSAPLSLRVPPSKSVTHRAALLAARADGPCVLERPLLGADCRSTLGALRALGAVVEIDEAGDGDEHARVAQVRITPVDAWRAPAEPIDCGNSGTTLRLLLAQAATMDRPVTFDGDGSLRKRPNAPLLAALHALGARAESRDGRLPITVMGPIRGGEVRLPPRVSSQYASGAILALALHPEGGVVKLAAPVASRPYLDVTAQVARDFGVALDVADEGAGGVTLRARGGQRPRARRYAIEGDWSGAAFPLVGAALLGREVRLEGLRADSVQGDRALLEHLRAFGLAPRWEGDAVCSPPRALRGAGALDLGATPDLFPALCALAAVAPGETVLGNAPSLRDKESDRIAAMARGLAALGVRVEELDDGLRIEGGRPHGGSVESLGDHRVYMSFALLGAVASGEVRVSEAGCEAVSYPDFGAHLAALSRG